MTVACANRILSEDLAIEFLTDTTLTNAQMAEKHGVALETVRRVRVGETYSEIRPDIPRWTKRQRASRLSCWDCVHGIAGVKKRSANDTRTIPCVTCSLGFPDPQRYGAQFANQCSVYLHKNDEGMYRQAA